MSIDKKYKESAKIRKRWFKDYGKLKEAHLKTYNIVPELKKLFDEFNDSKNFYFYNRDLENASELELNILNEFKKITNSNIDDYLGTFIEAMNSSENIQLIEGFVFDLVDAISLAICGKDYATYFYNHTYKEQKQIAEKLKILFWEYGKYRLSLEYEEYHCKYHSWF